MTTDDASSFGEDQFRHLVESIEDYAIFFLNVEGRITSWNKGARHITGYSKEEIIGQHFSIFQIEADHTDSNPASQLEIARSRGRFTEEGWRRRKDGNRFLASIVISALYDASGHLLGYTKISKDMTEKKRLEERFRRVVESAPNAMVMINQHGSIEMVNAQAEILFDYARTDMIGQPIEILVPERFRHGHPEKRSLFFGDPQSRPMGVGRDLFGRRKDGSEFPVEIGLNPIETEVGTMVLSSIVDISDRKQKEARIQAALKEKDLLLGEIHHRVKNNLQVVHSLLNLQSSRINDPLVKNMLLDSQNRIQSMALIHQTLYQSHDFAKVDFSGFLDVLVSNLVNSYRVNSQDIQVHIDVQTILLPINSAIPCGLLINELITNSLKHAFPGGRQGQINITLTPCDRSTIRLGISDNGIGIPDHVSMSNSATLGLRLITLLSQQLDGKLTINRRDPTEFNLEFPMTDN